MKNFAKRFVLSTPILAVFLAVFSLVLLCHEPSPVMAQEKQETQEELLKKSKARQAKMMETQFLMIQMMQLEHNADMRKELEIVGDQVDALKKLAQEYQAASMEFHSKNSKMMVKVQQLLKDSKPLEAQKLAQQFQQKNQDLSEKYMEKLSETLLPHQIERLTQISKQQRVKSMNRFSDEFGVAAALADEIGLSEKEKVKLIETIKEARREYYEKVEALKKVANEKIMSSLTTEQQQKMREILGDTFDEKKSRRRNMEAIRAKQNDARKRWEELNKKKQKDDY